MRILVTGVSGFAGAMLAPELLAAGHELRALARDPERAARALAERGRVLAATGSATPDIQARLAGDVEVVRGDVLGGEGLRDALDGIEVAYYLIHSMESIERGGGEQDGFPERERLGALHFAQAAAAAGVGRIVYLGGLQPGDPTGASRHLASRAEVERILFAHVPDSVALRSAIVIGARSRSFRVMVRLLERMPALALPRWRDFRTRPIDARDVVAMLVAAAGVAGVGGRSLDVGGPEVLSYGELLGRIATLMLLPRPALALGIEATALTGRVVAAVTGEDPEFILPLMEGLTSDLLPAEDHAAELLGVSLHSVEAAIECALREWETVEPLAAR